MKLNSCSFSLLLCNKNLGDLKSHELPLTNLFPLFSVGITYNSTKDVFASMG